MQLYVVINRQNSLQLASCLGINLKGSEEIGNGHTKKS